MSARIGAIALLLPLLLPVVPAGAAGDADTGAAAKVLPPLIQQLMDAIPADPSVWQRYMADDGVYVGEGGEVIGKKELLDGFHPFPPGLSGRIKVLEPKITEAGGTAIAVFDALESETVFGQRIEVTYLNTQTWRQEAGHWRLLATQVAVRARDPAPLPADATRLADYAGTYALGQWAYAVQVKDGVLYGGSPKQLKPLIAVGDNVFAETGSPLGVLRIFVRDRTGAVTRMIQRRKFADLEWQRVSAALPETAPGKAGDKAPGQGPAKP